MTDIEVLVVESPCKGVMINGSYPVSNNLQVDRMTFRTIAVLSISPAVMLGACHTGQLVRHHVYNTVCMSLTAIQYA